MNDFVLNPSFISILWSQGRGSGNWWAFSSLKMSRYSWNSLGTSSSSVFSSFLLFSLIASSVATFVLLIHAVSSSSSIKIVFLFSSIGFFVWFLVSSSSTISSIFGCHSILIFCPFSRSPLQSIFKGCHLISPFSQLIIRLCLFSQENPKIIFCFPNPVT